MKKICFTCDDSQTNVYFVFSEYLFRWSYLILILEHFVSDYSCFGQRWARFIIVYADLRALLKNFRQECLMPPVFLRIGVSTICCLKSVSTSVAFRTAHCVITSSSKHFSINCLRYLSLALSSFPLSPLSPAPSSIICCTRRYHSIP